MEKDSDLITIGGMLYGYVPSPKDREQLIKARDFFSRFVSNLGPAYKYVIKDYLEAICVSFRLTSNYRGRHTIEFSFVRSLDEVRFEAKFKTPRLHDGIGGEESLAIDLFMELHNDEMGVYKDDYDRDNLRWTVDICPYETEITEQMISDAYNRLLKASTYIIRKMESAYWENYSISNLSADTVRGGHITECKWSCLYEVFEGETNTGKRALFFDDDCGEVYIERHSSLQNKVHIGRFYSYPVGPDEEEEKEFVRETYEIEKDDERFYFKDTTKSDVPRMTIIGEGGIIPNTDYLYCMFKDCDNNHSTCVITKDPDETIHLFELEEDGDINEIGIIEKPDPDQVKPFKDPDETQMNTTYRVSTSIRNPERIAIVYAVVLLSI